ncbi:MULTISPECIES: hypothetical protein [unclassified Mesorhizobium]|uniref:hypothetical protein n=1 Tax=unclassified Mesorhizobium TaxID=325217 RepID=UPI001FE007BF|nr:MULTISPECIES: hypothetical protein [unclassified Mesorhizobium]
MAGIQPFGLEFWASFPSRPEEFTQGTRAPIVKLFEEQRIEPVQAAAMRSVPRFRCKHQAGFEQMHMWILPPGQRPMLVLGPAARRIGESGVDGREQNFDLLAIGDAVRGCEKGGER